MGDGVLIRFDSVFQHLSDHLTYTVSVGSSHGNSDYLHQLVTRQHDVTVMLPDMTSQIHLSITAVAPVGTHVIYTDELTR